MKKLPIRLIVQLLLIFLLASQLSSKNSPSPFALSQTSSGFGWNLLVDKSSNATFWWLANSSSLLDAAYDWLFIIVCILLTAIWALTIHTITTTKLQEAIVSAIILILATLNVAGINFVLLNFLFHASGLILLRQKLKQDLNHGLWYTALLSGCFLFLSAQWSYIFLILTIATLARARLDAKQKKLTLHYFAALTLTSIFLGLVIDLHRQRPSIPTFGYPESARVVPDDGLPGMITPLVGETTIIPFINRNQLKSNYRESAFALLLMLVLTGIVRKNWRINSFAFSYPLIILLGWDILATEEIAHIGPIETARRILPGIFPLPVTAYLFPLTWYLLALDVFRINALRPGFLVLITVLALSHVDTPIDQLRENEDILSQKLHNIYASPSRNVALFQSAYDLTQFLNQEPSETKTVADLGGEISASHRQKQKITKLLSDGRSHTRWSPIRGAQYGGEWLQVTLPETVSVTGIQLLPGNFYTDFPRGIEIASCDSAQTTTQIIKRISDWQGAIKFSSEGYPYYSGQHDVTVHFSTPVKTSCIKITQIGEEGHFDWSVAELKLSVLPG